MQDKPPASLTSLPRISQCRPASSRAGNLCFWTVALLFCAGIGYLGLLAFTRDIIQPSPGAIGHLLFASLLVVFAIVIVIVVISTYNRRINH
jgi:hypothetical protein